MTTLSPKEFKLYIQKMSIKYAVGSNDKEQEQIQEQMNNNTVSNPLVEQGSTMPPTTSIPKPVLGGKTRKRFKKINKKTKKTKNN